MDLSNKLPIRPDEQEILKAFENVCNLDVKDWPFAYRRFKLGWIAAKEVGETRRKRLG